MDLEGLISDGEGQIHLAFLTPDPSLGKPEPAWKRLVDSGHLTLAELASHTDDLQETYLGSGIYE